MYSGNFKSDGRASFTTAQRGKTSVIPHRSGHKAPQDSHRGRPDSTRLSSVASSIDRRSVSSSSVISSSSDRSELEYWKFNVGFDQERWLYFNFETQKIVKRRSAGRREAIAGTATSDIQQSSPKTKHDSHKPTTKEHKHATKKRSTAKPLR